MDWRIRYEYAVITLRVDADIFVSGKKKLRIQKYADTCGRGLSGDLVFLLLSVITLYNVTNSLGKIICWPLNGGKETYK